MWPTRSSWQVTWRGRNIQGRNWEVVPGIGRLCRKRLSPCMNIILLNGLRCAYNRTDQTDWLGKTMLHNMYKTTQMSHTLFNAGTFVSLHKFSPLDPTDINSAFKESLFLAFLQFTTHQCCSTLGPSTSTWMYFSEGLKFMKSWSELLHICPTHQFQLQAMHQLYLTRKCKFRSYNYTKVTFRKIPFGAVPQFILSYCIQETYESERKIWVRLLTQIFEMELDNVSINFIYIFTIYFLQLKHTFQWMMCGSWNIVVTIIWFVGITFR
jgi:hypothetical protein